jgi:hypothetical protein
MISKIVKAGIGILLVPVVIGISLSLFGSLNNIGHARNAGSNVFLLGALAYVIMHLFIFKPNYLYTLGHEFMHAIATWICGGRIKSFNVSEGGGSVETTKSNFFITLSPYFVPTYTLLFSILYLVIPLFGKVPNLGTIYFFMAGLSLMMHLVFTAEVLRREQPDVVNTGYIFSIVIIYIANLFLVGLVVSLLFEGIAFKSFALDAYEYSKEIYIRIFRQLFFL